MMSATPVKRNALALVLTVGLMTSVAAGNEALLVEHGEVRTTVIVCETLYDRWDGLHERYVENRFSRDEYRERGSEQWEVPWVDLAVEELEEHLGLVGEGELRMRVVSVEEVDAAIDEALEAGRTVLALLGPESAGARHDALADAAEHPEAFLRETAGAKIVLTGLSPKGVFNGTLDLLEAVGFRWYMPGELGRVVPTGDTLAVEPGRVIDEPSYRFRSMGRFPEWSRRARNSPSGVRAPAGHGMRPLSSSGARRNWFEEDESHQAHFALRDGRRVPGQLCVSNEEVLELVVDYWREELAENKDNYRTGDGRLVIGMGPNDGSGWCECDDCRALDGGVKTAFTNRLSVTDRYFWFYNRVLEALEDDYPDLHIGTMLYADQMDPPVRVEPKQRIVGGIIAIHTCRKHAMTSPVCPEAQYRQWLIERWQELLGEENVRYSNYRFHLADPGLPFMMMGREREEIPRAHEMGVRSAGGPMGVNWANEGPSLYVLSRLLWNHEADVDAILEEFFDKFYGPAAEPMRRYTMGLDEALHTADYHGGAAVDMRHIYDADIRSMARDALEEARRLTEGQGLYETRVEIAHKGWQYFEAFAEMIEQRHAHDFVASMEAYQRATQIQERLKEGYEYPLIRGLQARFLHRMSRYAGRTESGYERVTGGNEMVVGLSPEWQFQIEPQGIGGERMGLHKPKTVGGRWRTISVEKTWSHYGLRHYWGQAWYRQSVDIPAEHKGRGLRIWFGGLVSSGAKVYVNGEPVGTSPGAGFDDFGLAAHSGSGLPFELDITDAVRFDEPNVVTVRVVRDAMHEIGKGGLQGPAIIYAPME